MSADMAHGVHPNFIDKHEENHRPVLQKGLVIKHNANQHYATSGVTSFLFKEVAKLHNLPIQVNKVLRELMLLNKEKNETVIACLCIEWDMLLRSWLFFGHWEIICFVCTNFECTSHASMLLSTT